MALVIQTQSNFRKRISKPKGRGDAWFKSEPIKIISLVVLCFKVKFAVTNCTFLWQMQGGKKIIWERNMNREEGMLKVKSTVKPVSRNGPILRITENSSFCHFPFTVLETWYTKNIQMYISITIEPWHHKASYQNLLFCCNAQRERTHQKTHAQRTRAQHS